MFRLILMLIPAYAVLAKFLVQSSIHDKKDRVCLKNTKHCLTHNLPVVNLPL